MTPNRSREEDQPQNFLDSGLFKFGSKLLLMIIVAVLFLTLVQCTVKKPEAPEWNTTALVPAINRTYPMAEIIQRIDQDGIGFDSDSNVIYSFTGDIDTVRLESDNLRTPDLAYDLSQTLGPIDLDLPTVDPVTISFSDIGGLPPGAIPPVSFDITAAMPTATSFVSANVQTGRVWVVLTNDLGVDIDTAIATLWDAGNNSAVDTREISGGLSVNETDSVLFVLDGTSVSNQFEVRTHCHTPGGTVLSTADKSLTTGVRFTDRLTVTSATAQVPALSRSFSQQVALDETDAVHRAYLSGGQLHLTIDNNSRLGADVEIRLPDLQTAGQPLSITRTVGPQASDAATIDLTGFELTPLDQTLPQELGFEVIASMPGSGASVPISEGDYFDVSASLSGLEFTSVTGVFSYRQTAIDPSVETIDVPRGFDSLQLTTGIVALEIENRVNMPGDLNLTLTGDNGKVFNLTGQVQAGGVGVPVTTLILDSTAADFLFPVPSQVTLDGTVSFGDGATVSTINADDYVYARLDFTAPMEMIIGQTTIDSDIESEKIDVEDIDIITDHVTEARFTYNITNHLPLGLDVDILLSGDSTTLLTDPELRIEGLSVRAAPVTAGLVSDTLSTGYQTIVLTNDDIQVLNNDMLFVAQQITLHSSNGEVVRLTNRDYVTVTGYFDVEYRFDGSL